MLKYNTFLIKERILKEYEQIPRIFEENTKWIKCTEYLCNYCTRYIRSDIMTVITQKDKDIYHINGVFCSSRCVKTYIILNYPNKYNEYNILYQLWYKNVYKKEINLDNYSIRPSYNKLVKYGGKFTDAQYEML